MPVPRAALAMRGLAEAPLAEFNCQPGAGGLVQRDESAMPLGRADGGVSRRGALAGSDFAMTSC